MESPFVIDREAVANDRYASRLLPPSVSLPPPRQLPLAEPDISPRYGLAIESSSRRIALEAALADFVEVLVQEAVDSPDWIPGSAERARSHYEGMFRTTLHGLLLAADQAAWAAFLLDNAGTVSRHLMRLIREQSGASRAEVLRSPLIYGVARTYAGSIWHWAGEVAGEVARESVEAEVAVFPHLLTVMRDNVLIFCHRKSPRAEDLGGYVASLWGLPGDELVASMHDAEAALRSQWNGLPDWMQRELGIHVEGEELHRRWPHLMVLFAESEGRGAPSRQQAVIWEELQLRRRQFAALAAVRDQIVVVERRDNSWFEVGDDRERAVRFAPDLRPLPLFSTEGAGTTVRRFGLRYDITNFSTTMASLELMPVAARETALRRFFFFQRRVQNAARRHGLHLEKYFGDGILFSSAHSAREVLAAALEIQRAYRHAVDRGMVFAGGIRLAANWGTYRVVARVGDVGGNRDGQLFGPGIVEISRLVSGKISRDLSEIKKLLTGAGYRRQEVRKFFARFEQRNIQLVDDATESRRFWAYVNPNGTLVNEGIVITASFFARVLGSVPAAVGRHREAGREFLLLDLADRRSEPLLAGITHRGFAEFKGLAPIEVFEVVDAQEWNDVAFGDGGVEISDFTWLPEPAYD